MYAPVHLPAPLALTFPIRGPEGQCAAAHSPVRARPTPFAGGRGRGKGPSMIGAPEGRKNLFLNETVLGTAPNFLLDSAPQSFFPMTCEMQGSAFYRFLLFHAFTASSSFILSGPAA